MSSDLASYFFSDSSKKQIADFLREAYNTLASDYKVSIANLQDPLFKSLYTLHKEYRVAVVTGTTANYIPPQPSNFITFATSFEKVCAVALKYLNQFNYCLNKICRKYSRKILKETHASLVNMDACLVEYMNFADFLVNPEYASARATTLNPEGYIERLKERHKEILAIQVYPRA